MLNNPFAGVFRQAFMKDVLSCAVYTPTAVKQYPDRVRYFMDNLNHFLKTAGKSPILYQKYAFNEHKLFEYALFLRGYMRDSQKILATLEQKYAADEHLIDLFQASSEYIVACNHQLHDKRVFDNNVAYHFWKIDLQNGLQDAHYLPQQPVPEKHNLFLFMPFRVTDDEKTLNKWLYANMHDTLNNREIFVKNVDTFVIFYPIQKSRASNITSLLKTIRDGNTYFEKQDMVYVQKNWLQFIAQDIQIDENGNVISAKPYSKEKLFSNLRNMTIFSYCAGTANAHRCLNALYKVGRQIYDCQTMETAIRNICLISYGYLPHQRHSLSSGVHFYTNAINDDQRREPFVNLNNHELYEQTKCRDNQKPARFSVMPDGRNYIVALKMAQPLTIVENGIFKNITDNEYGHNMAHVSTPNIHNTFAHDTFKSVLENASLGIRGKQLFKIQQTANQTTNLALLSQIQYIR